MKEKYAPTKVFILENGTYTEISYKELCYREETDPTYTDKLFLPLHGMLMEVPENVYSAFYKEQRRQKYIDERSEANGDVSYDAISNDEFNGEIIAVDESTDVAEQVMNQIMLEKIYLAIQLLNDAEKELIDLHFYQEISQTDIAKRYGVNQSNISRRISRILEKIKKFVEI